MCDVTIERVHAPTDEIVSGLATLLLDAVADNAGISFMAGLTEGRGGGLVAQAAGRGHRENAANVVTIR